MEPARVGSLKQSEVKRKKGSAKSISGKNVKRLSSDDDKKETTPVLKPAQKLEVNQRIKALLKLEVNLVAQVQKSLAS